MPLYSYKAKNLQGGEESGTMEAANQAELGRVLHQRGYFLLTASVDNGRGKKTAWASLEKAFSNLFGVPLTEKLFFTRNLEIMVKTGVALPRALNVLSLQVKNAKFKRILLRLSEDITKGESLSGCLAAFPSVFPVLYQETLKIGEETGKLEDALHILGQQMEREHKLRSSISTAMVYPVIVMVMAFLIGIVMFVFAVPKLKTTFTEMNVALPFTTQAIFGLADFLIKRWPFVLLLFILIIISGLLLDKMKSAKPFKSLIFLKIPIIGKVVRTTNSALMLRVLSSLLEAGVPIVRALGVASGSLRNFYFQQSLKEAALAVEKGTKLSQAMSGYTKLYPITVFHMMEVGEETGETPEVLKKLADFYEDEVISATEKLASLMEPALIVFIGGVVGFFALSMLQPMFSMTSAIK